MSLPACRTASRRAAVRDSPRLAGLDYVDVRDDPRSLRVHFLGRLPQTTLGPEHFRIEGGRRIRDLRVVQAFPKTFHDPELDDYVDLVLDRVGDFSTYTLRAVQRVVDPVTGPRWIPHPELDPAYDAVTFGFGADCQTDLDCASTATCPPDPRYEPTIDMLAKDYASFRRLILDRLAAVMPDWTNRAAPDLGITLVELLAYAGDHLSYYQDAVATEAYLDTARQRISVRRHSRLVDYRPHEGCNARAFVVVGVASPVTLTPGAIELTTPVALHAPTELSREGVARLDGAGYEVFEPVGETDLVPGQDALRIYTWGNSECCLARGATTATLVDAWTGAAQARTRALRLRAGDWLIFEEVLGPGTGSAADRDPSHRWVVRLTAATPGVDPLTETPVLEVEWAREDALPFPLCLSTVGSPPRCERLTDVSVARGNVVLVDHGRTIVEDLPRVEPAASDPACEAPGLPAEVTPQARPFRPVLAQPNLTFREPLTAQVAAARALAQDPHRAVPLITVANGRWLPVPDLLASRATDRHFVVELDNERRAGLRFGNGAHGARPPVGRVLRAQYRIGIGRAGNVGAESIVHAVWKDAVSGFVTSVRNPLPARGGIDPQPIEEVKRLAPQAFRQRLERAITAEDYAAIATREFPTEVQRAAAALRWNGSWHEVLVAIDAAGQETASQDLLRRVWRRLHDYRRIGYDLRVEAAVRVPVLISLGICLEAVYLRAHVLADLRAAFGTGRLPDGRLGFFHADRLTFGHALALSQVIALAQRVPGVASVRTLRFERLFDGPRGEIEQGLLPFGALEIAQCDSDPSLPEHGRLEFHLGGGR